MPTRVAGREKQLARYCVGAGVVIGVGDLDHVGQVRHPAGEQHAAEQAGDDVRRAVGYRNPYP